MTIMWTNLYLHLCLKTHNMAISQLSGHIY